MGSGGDQGISCGRGWYEIPREMERIHAQTVASREKYRSRQGYPPRLPHSARTASYPFPAATAYPRLGFDPSYLDRRERHRFYCSGGPYLASAGRPRLRARIAAGSDYCYSRAPSRGSKPCCAAFTSSASISPPCLSCSLLTPFSMPSMYISFGKISFSYLFTIPLSFFLICPAGISHTNLSLNGLTLRCSRKGLGEDNN